MAEKTTPIGHEAAMKMRRLFPVLLILFVCGGAYAQLAPSISSDETTPTLSQELSGPASPAQLTVEAEEKSKQIESLLVELKQSQELAAEVEKIRSTRGIARLLRNLRDELPEASVWREEMRKTQAEMNRAQERRIQLRGEVVVEDSEVSSIEKLIQDYRKYETALRSLYFAQDRLVKQIEITERAFAERLLWLRGMPVSADSLKETGTAAKWLFSPGSWKSSSMALAADVRSSPLGYILVALLVVLIYAARIRTEKFDSAVGSLARAFLNALPIPLVLGFIGRRLSLSGETDAFSASLGHGLLSLALGLFIVLFLQSLLKADGFFSRQYSLASQRLAAGRKALALVAPIFLPAVLVVSVIEAYGFEPFRYSLGRFALVAVHVSLGLLAWRGLRMEVPSEASWGSGRLWSLIRPALLLVFLVLILMAVTGYYDASLILTRRLAATLYLALGLLILQAIFSKWLKDSLLRLAYQQSKREKEHRPAIQDDLIPESDEVIQRDREPNVASIHAQAFRLMHFSFWIVLALGLWAIWSDILPALKFMGELKVWTVVAQTDQGEREARIIALSHVVLAILVLVAMLVANRNLPALLEVAVLQHTTIEPSTRYAITTITRYLIILAGVMGASKIVGIGWNEVRWLVAAISVGLGFGLQEIFANFVSGLIILFERPVRIGDIVTIGGATGKVTRIRIRATTILDWEHKELIIPNKEFITGQVLNWTLSDSIVRLSVKVRVPYGTNVEQARKILVEVAGNHPNVLDDPPPLAAVSEFADTMVVIDLFAHLPSLDNFMKTKNEIYCQIEEAFAKEGIDFTWLQREMRMREQREAREQGEPIIRPEEKTKGR